MSETLAGLTRQAEIDPAFPAIVTCSRRLSYGQLSGLVADLANELLTSGLRAGDRVVLGCGTGLIFVVALLALREIGAFAVPVEASVGAISRACATTDPAGLLVLRRDLADQPGWTIRSSQTVNDRMDLNMEIGRRAAHRGPISSAGGGVVVQTSGSTGAPKNILLNSAYIDQVAAVGRSLVGLRRNDRLAVLAPITHFYALREIDAVIGCGARLILASDNRFQAPMLDLLNRECPTIAVAVPSVADRLLNSRFRGAFVRSMKETRIIALGTARAPPELRQQITEALSDARLLLTYGLTECSRVACGFSDEIPCDSVGQAAPGAAIEIIDNNDRPCPPGVTGRVFVKSAGVMSGYWQDGVITSVQLTDRGFLSTGDLGQMEADGCLTLKGRSDNVANVAGYRVSLDEIDFVLSGHPLVAEAATIAMKDERLDEIVAVSVVVVREEAEISTAQLIAHCARMLPRSHCPRLIAIAQSVPKTILGKVDRPRLIERLAEQHSTLIPLALPPKPQEA